MESSPARNAVNIRWRGLEVGVIGAAGENVCKKLGQVELREGRGGSKWQPVAVVGRRRVVFGLGGKEELVGRRVRRWCPGEAALSLILSKKFLPVNSNFTHIMSGFSRNKRSLSIISLLIKQICTFGKEFPCHKIGKQKMIEVEKEVW